VTRRDEGAPAFAAPPLACDSHSALFNLLGAWVPDEVTRRRILVDNPRELFGF